MERLEIEGYFWLPGRPEDRAAGTLTFHPADGSELALIGALDTRLSVSRIVGEASDGLYTLEDCFLLRETNSVITKQRFRVNRVLGGVGYGEDEPLVFDRFTVGLTNLLEWIEPPEMPEDIRWGVGPDGREQRYTISLDPFETRQLSVSAGTLALRQWRGVDGDGLNERRLRQSCFFEMTLNQTVPLEDAVDVASDLQDLVSIGTHRVAAFDFLHLYHAETFTEGPNGSRRPEAARLLAPWLARTEEGKRHPHSYQMAFTFGELGGMAGVARWLETAARYRSMLGRVMATRYVRMFVEDRFLHRTTALDGLHLKWAGTTQSRFLTRLKAMCKLAGQPMTSLVQDVDAWCAKAKAERDNLAHHYGRTIHQDSTDLLYSSEVAYWLFVVCFLRLAQAPDAVFEHVMKNPDYNWLRDQLAASGN